MWNRRVMVLPAQRTDLHRPCLARGELDRLLCRKTWRVRRNDQTVAHNGQLYQVQTNGRTTQVVRREWLDGTLRMTHQGQALV